MTEKLEVLISCMNQKDLSIAERTGVRTDTLIINQCPGETPPREKMNQETLLTLPEGGTVRVRMLTTPEKGLSRSRNLALRYAEGHVALICDDDEKLSPDYAEIIFRGYRELPEADVETLMVLDATTGQNGLIQAKQFLETSGLTGIVLTKLDGTAKGGIVFAIAGEMHLPVKFIGVGEQIDDLMPFDAHGFVEALLQ